MVPASRFFSRTARSPAEIERQASKIVELFQLLFLEAARPELPPGEYALKGGGNLRFFLRSRRRSADLDFDYIGRRFADFGDRLDRVLQSRVLSDLLRARAVSLHDVRRSKDTATVKRWKLALRTVGTEAAASKIEFSGRPAGATPIFEAIDEHLARRAGIGTVRLNHYGPAPSIEQKVSALAGRGETEPRDIFDLDHLFREFPDAIQSARLDGGTTRAAIDRALALPYADYEQLVVRYLEDDFLPLYGSAEAWNDMVLRVVARLEEWLKEGHR